LTIGTLLVPTAYQSLQVYQDCTNSVPIVKNNQNQSQDSQNSKNNHWCTNRHMSTNTVPTVYQSSKTVKNSQKPVKTAKMTIGVPIVTCLPRLYQQCTNRQKQSKTAKTLKTAKMTIGVPIVTCLPRLHQPCTNSVPIVKNSQKAVKTAKLPLVYQSSQSLPNTQSLRPSLRLRPPNTQSPYWKSLFKEPITGPLNFKMAEIRHLGS